MTARKSTGTLQAGESFTVTGTVSPNHAPQRVWLQRLVDGAWKTAASATLSGGSGYTVSAKPPTTGRLTYRVYKGADHDHVKAASATLYVTVGRGALAPAWSLRRRDLDLVVGGPVVRCHARWL